MYYLTILRLFALLITICSATPVHGNDQNNQHLSPRESTVSAEIKDFRYTSTSELEFQISWVVNGDASHFFTVVDRKLGNPEQQTLEFHGRGDELSWRATSARDTETEGEMQINMAFLYFPFKRTGQS